jgi:hypothetical protein
MPVYENNCTRNHCKCGWFLANVVATCRGPEGDEEIIKVEGDCKRCGRVETNDWDYEDFFSEDE